MSDKPDQEPQIPEAQKCTCEDKQHGWAVFAGPGAGYIICSQCGKKQRAMTPEDWELF